MTKQMTIRSHATTSRPSVTLARPAVSWTPESPTRTRVRHLPMLQNHAPIHEHVLDADRSLVRLLERRAVDHGDRIEHGDVGVQPGPDEATVGETDALRRERRHLPHCELQREQLQIAGVAAEDARKTAVGARVR